MIDDTRDIQKRYCSLALAMAIIAALLFLAMDAKPIAKGVVLGTLFSIINFILMAAILPLRLDKSRRQTFLIGLGSIGSRYLLLAVPLLIALKLDAIDFYSTAAGLFMVQVVLLGDHFTKMFFRR
jgi:hypothetical protein